FDRLPVSYQPEPDHRAAFFTSTYQEVVIDNLAVTGGPVRDPVSGIDWHQVFEIEAGLTGSTEILVRNHGRDEVLQITEAALTGPEAGSFRLGSSFPLEIPPGEARPIQVEADGAGPFGTLQADLVLTTNEAPSPLVTRKIRLEGILIPPADQPIQYEQNFDPFADGVTSLGDGSYINSTKPGGAETEGGVLKLTDIGLTETRSAFLVPPLGVGTRGSFRAVFDIAIEAEVPGLGFSLNFGKIADDAVGTTADLRRALSIEFNTAGLNNYGIAWEDFVGESIDLFARQASTPLRFFSEDPADPLFPFDLEPVECEVVWRRLDQSESSVSLRWGDRWIFEDVILTGLDPDPQWRLAFGAETGEDNGDDSLTESVFLDNVRIQSPAGDPFADPGVVDPAIVTDRKVFLAAEPGSRVTGSIAIRNEGKLEDLVVTGARLTTGSAEAFSIQTTFPLTVPPGGEASVDLEFGGSPDFGASKTTLILENNDSRTSRQSRRVELIGVVSPPGGMYDQDFSGFPEGTTRLFDGSVMAGLKGLPYVTGRQLLLTDLGNDNVFSSFRTPPLGREVAEHGLFASFDYAVAGMELISRGFSFNIGDFSNPAFPNGLGARGMGSGLAIEFETGRPVRDGLVLGFGMNVSFNRQVIAQRLLPEDADVSNTRFFESTAAGEPLQFKRAEVYLRYGENGQGFLDVWVGGDPVFQNVVIDDLNPTPAFQCGFSASTGSESWLIDRLTVRPASDEASLFLFGEVDFGFARNGDPVRTQPVYFRNSGRAPLEIADVFVLEGSDVFRVTSFPSTLAPGEAGSLVLEADPGQTFGLTTGLLRIASNDPLKPIQDVPLQISTPLSPSLLAHYPMDEPDGRVMIDRSGNRLDGVYSINGGGLVKLNQSGLAGGKAVRFGDNDSGGTGFARVDGFPALDSFTLSMWVQLDPDDSPGATFFSKGGDEGFRFALARLPGTGLTSWVVQENPDEPEFSEPGVMGSDPSHMVFAFDHKTSTSTLSINGQTVVQFTGENGFQDPGDPLFLGAFSDKTTVNGFSGILDDVQVYNRVLNPGEVDFLYTNAGLTLADQKETGVSVPSRLIVEAVAGSTEPFFLTIRNPSATLPLRLTTVDLISEVPGAFALQTPFPVEIEPGGETRLAFRYEAGLAIRGVTARLALTHDTVGVAVIPPITLSGYSVPSGNIYSEDFEGYPDGTTVLADGAVIGNETGTPAISVQEGVLALASVEEVYEASSFKTPVLGSFPNEGFMATFDYALSADPDGGPPGMGFSFNYGPISGGSDHGEGAEGFGPGLSIGFDTFDKFSLQLVDPSSDGLGVDLRIDGQIIESDKIFDVSPFSNRFYTISPHGLEPVFRNAQIIWLRESGSQGALTVLFDGMVVFDNVRTLNFNPRPDYRFALSASEGVGDQSVLIDDFGITGVTLPSRSPTDETLTLFRKQAVSFLSWISEARQTYQVQYSTDLFQWTPVGQVEGSGGLKSYVDPVPDRSSLSEGFYRTRLVE
ncbi:MAG: choice-of-anchor D domain-containing protein, partial [Verrucomicrobiota bacterium]